MNGFEQMKLVYDYIKFHLGLYLATPPVFAIIVEAFGVKEIILFQIGLVGMIVIYVLSGANAGLFMGRFINTQWTTGTLEEFNKVAYTRSRRRWHHTLYWVGVAIGVLFLSAAIAGKYSSGSLMWLQRPILDTVH